MAALRTLLYRGRNGGSWDGRGGIVSSSAAGDARKGLGWRFDQNTLAVRLSWAGDADLNGRVDADDYVAIDRGFLSGADGTYSEGDFDYNGKVNIGDYFLIDRVRATQATPPTPNAARPAAALTASPPHALDPMSPTAIPPSPFATDPVSSSDDRTGSDWLTWRRHC